MKQRCHNPNAFGFHRYGGRGIKVCDRWRTSFDTFLLDMGPRPDGLWIERKDNDGDYAPDNCVWVSPAAQYLNKSHTIYIEHEGERVTLAELARRLGVDYQSLHARYRKRGYSLRKSLLLCHLDQHLRRLMSMR